MLLGEADTLVCDAATQMWWYDPLKCFTLKWISSIQISLYEFTYRLSELRCYTPNPKSVERVKRILLHCVEIAGVAYIADAMQRRATSTIDPCLDPTLDFARSGLRNTVKFYRHRRSRGIASVEVQRWGRG